MKNYIKIVLSCSALVFAPLLLEAKTTCKRDFDIGSYHPEIRVGFSKTEMLDDGTSLIVLSDGSRWAIQKQVQRSISSDRK